MSGRRGASAHFVGLGRLTLAAIGQRHLSTANVTTHFASGRSCSLSAYVHCRQVPHASLRRSKRCLGVLGRQRPTLRHAGKCTLHKAPDTSPVRSVKSIVIFHSNSTANPSTAVHNKHTKFTHIENNKDVGLDGAVVSKHTH